uniref:Uncharacterized protein n=1 Tax=Zea mays TaxID=4577 RepID=A0A804MDZ0_MAIZE
MTMETTYLWGSFTRVFFVLCHTTYLEFVAFHFIAFSPPRRVAGLVPASGDNLREKKGARSGKLGHEELAASIKQQMRCNLHESLGYYLRMTSILSIQV